ncbi:MAG: LysM peptidoglycan-binding domain-containing protein [Aggregatilineales bacterium]
MKQLATNSRTRLLALSALCALLALGGAAVAQDSADSARAGQLYTVAAGDTLDSIAADFGVPAVCLLAANDIADPAGLEAGAELIIPSDCSAFVGGAVEARALDVGEGGLVDVRYTVRAGDRLSRIARRYNTTVACIAQANGIRNPDLIYIGQALVIPAACQAGGGGGDASGEAGVIVSNGQCLFDRYAGRRAVGGQYVVPFADMLDFIGCDFNVQTACLAAANGLPPTARLSAGQVLFIDQSCPPWDGPPGPARGRSGR